MAGNKLLVVCGETKNRLNFVYKDKDGNVVNITGYSFLFKIRSQTGTANTNNAANTGHLDVPLSGMFYYQYNAGDFPTPGTYLGQLWVTSPDALIHKVPVEIIFQARTSF